MKKHNQKYPFFKAQLNFKFLKQVSINLNNGIKFTSILIDNNFQSVIKLEISK